MIILNNITYKTKSSVKKIIQDILYKYSIDEKINLEDKVIIKDLLKYHPESSTKIGCGIKDIIIQQNIYNTRGFKIIREDNSTTDFSYLACINPPSLASEIKTCCRTAIQNDIYQFKIVQFNASSTIKCPITNEFITFKNSEVDHYNPTFNELFSTWIKDKKITKEDINQTTDNEQKTFFTNKSLELDFINYHRKNAKLRIVSILANRSILRKKQ